MYIYARVYVHNVRCAACDNSARRRVFCKIDETILHVLEYPGSALSSTIPASNAAAARHYLRARRRPLSGNNGARGYNINRPDGPPSI